ncbi:hypothetical protein Dfri01_33980 [Dyadobacter frigoris]|uniref:DUF2683 family protein n=1 Tax=Dyadobacter frigoris TaxID=2576211 RepID=UPI0024A16118|nr:DUF2683 family protein [Dyadobacter frigoris]GLU53937.1 hypothetical protein Dfri01_33980 [Dyadobacter frigoris]
MTTLTIETEDPQIIKAVKALLKGFEVNYKEDSDSPYDPKFVEKIRKSEQQIMEGKTVKFESGTNLWDLATTK